MRPITQTQTLANGLTKHIFNDGTTITFGEKTEYSEEYKSKISYFVFPNGEPVTSEQLPNGDTVHTFEGGRKYEVNREPTHTLQYQSTYLGAKLGETYDVPVCIFDFSVVEGFFEVWNYDCGLLRSYKFEKTVSIIELSSGEIFNSGQLKDALQRKQTLERTP